MLLKHASQSTVCSFLCFEVLQDLEMIVCFEDIKFHLFSDRNQLLIRFNNYCQQRKLTEPKASLKQLWGWHLYFKNWTSGLINSYFIFHPTWFWHEIFFWSKVLESIKDLYHHVFRYILCMINVTKRNNDHRYKENIKEYMNHIRKSRKIIRNMYNFY